jgi:hypothetical protein
MIADEYSSARLGSLVAASMAASGIERVVSIWDVETGQKLNEMITTRDSGGGRLLLTPDGELCITAGYAQHGLACYRSLDSRQVWHRHDLKRIQQLSVTRDGRGVYCEFEGRPTQKVDAESGQSLRSYKGVKKIVESPFMPVCYHQNKVASLRTDGDEQIAVIPASTILHAVFSPEKLCISEACGPVRCFNVQSGVEVWRYTPKKGSHVVGMGYCEPVTCFFGVEYPYAIGGASKLVRLADSSEAVVVREIWHGAHAFCSSTRLFLTADGEVIDLTDSSTVRRLDFEDRS